MYLSDLPGKAAHLKMAPEPRILTLKTESAPPMGARDSAVLVLLFPSPDPKELLDWEVIVIKRNTYEGVHSGQVAFPGGKCEESDKDYIATACREAFEELGIIKNKIEILGLMSRIYVPPSNFTIYPVLAYVKEDLKFVADIREVAEFRKFPLSLFNPELSKTINISVSKDSTINAPSYIIGDYTIWGATAMILAELYQLIVEDKLRISFNNP